MKPARDPCYLSWVRRHSCCACGRRGFSHSHHLEPNMARRGSDLRTVPLCAEHHLFGREAIHQVGKSEFARRFNLDFDAIVRRLNADYLEWYIEHGEVPDGLVMGGRLPGRSELTAEA